MKTQTLTPLNLALATAFLSLSGLAAAQGSSSAPAKPAEDSKADADAGPELVAGIGFIGQVIDGLDAKNLRGMIDDAKTRMGSGVAVLVAVNDGKGSVSVGVTDDLIGRFSAVDLVRIAASAMGGQGGGGRLDMAQAGGPDGAKAADAVAAVRAALAG